CRFRRSNSTTRPPHFLPRRSHVSRGPSCANAPIFPETTARVVAFGTENVAGEGPPFAPQTAARAAQATTKRACMGRIYAQLVTTATQSRNDEGRRFTSSERA